MNKLTSIFAIIMVLIVSFIVFILFKVQLGYIHGYAGKEVNTTINDFICFYSKFDSHSANNVIEASKELKNLKFDNNSAQLIYDFIKSIKDIKDSVSECAKHYIEETKNENKVEKMADMVLDYIPMGNIIKSGITLVDKAKKLKNLIDNITALHNVNFKNLFDIHNELYNLSKGIGGSCNAIEELYSTDMEFIVSLIDELKKLYSLL